MPCRCRPSKVSCALAAANSSRCSAKRAELRVRRGDRIGSATWECTSAGKSAQLPDEETLCSSHPGARRRILGCAAYRRNARQPGNCRQIGGPAAGERARISGATILGDGRIVLILDINALVRTGAPDRRVEERGAGPTDDRPLAWWSTIRSPSRVSWSASSNAMACASLPQKTAWTVSACCAITGPTSSCSTSKCRAWMATNLPRTCATMHGYPMCRSS